MVTCKQRRDFPVQLLLSAKFIARRNVKHSKNIKNMAELNIMPRAGRVTAQMIELGKRPNLTIIPKPHKRASDANVLLHGQTNQPRARDASHGQTAWQQHKSGHQRTEKYTKTYYHQDRLHIDLLSSVCSKSPVLELFTLHMFMTSSYGCTVQLCSDPRAT